MGQAVTIEELLAIARNVTHARQSGPNVPGSNSWWRLNADRLGRGIIDLLGEAQPCGWAEPALTPVDRGEMLVSIPEQWTGCHLTADEARAWAVMLLRAADEADARKATSHE